jgi:predicted TIM-barrel fold metal-dependent hydrolase
VLSDPTLRKTNFVLIHGGWPYTDLVGFLLAKPNVWADISAMDFVLYPRELSQVLRKWISLVPERVLYGGDVEPFMPQINWEETGWLTITTARKALAIALSGMLADGEITRERAVQVARLVLHDNAAKLYGLP